MFFILTKTSGRPFAILLASFNAIDDSNISELDPQCEVTDVGGQRHLVMETFEEILAILVDARDASDQDKPIASSRAHGLLEDFVAKNTTEPAGKEVLEVREPGAEPTVTVTKEELADLVVPKGLVDDDEDDGTIPSATRA